MSSQRTRWLRRVFQFSRLSPAVLATGGERPPVVLIGINDPLKLVTGTLVAGTSTSGASDRSEDRFQFQEVFSYVSGNHSLKFGGDIQRIKSTFIDLEDASGTWDFDSAGDFLANAPEPFPPKLSHDFDTAQYLHRGLLPGRVAHQTELHDQLRLAVRE